MLPKIKWQCFFDEVAGLQTLKSSADCLVIGSNFKFKCHSLILACASKFFHSILHKAREENEEIVLLLPDWQSQEMQALESVVYTGTLNYPEEDEDKIDNLASTLESVGIYGYSLRKNNLESNHNLVISDVKTDLSDHRNNKFTSTTCFRCNGEQSSHAEYISHLREHTASTRMCFTTLTNALEEGVEADWICDSCYSTLLQEKDLSLGKQYCWNILNIHQKDCIQAVEDEIKVANHKPSTSCELGEAFLTNPSCTSCGKSFKLRIELKLHQRNCKLVSKTDTRNSESLLEFIKTSKWTQCPYCSSDIDYRELPQHLLNHAVFLDLLQNDTSVENHYTCKDSRCGFKLPGSHRFCFILHKYRNCKFSAMDNLKQVLIKAEKDFPDGDSVISKDESNKSGSIKCQYCLRVFTTMEEFNSTSKHFCRLVGNPKKPIEETCKPSASVRKTFQCLICVDGPVLKSEFQYKKHISISHKGIAMRSFLKRKGFDSGEGSCPLGCGVNLIGWHDAVMHVALIHERLFHEMYSDTSEKKSQYSELTERFYSKQVKELKQQQSINNNAGSVIKEREGNIDKLVVKLGDDINRQDTDNIRGSASKAIFSCSICHSANNKYSSIQSLYQHMAWAHFSTYILLHYPHQEPQQNYYACKFPNCDTVLNSGEARVKHIGFVHKLVDLCLATPKVLMKAKEEVRGVKETGTRKSLKISRSCLSQKLMCKTCSLSFATKESLKLHTCYSIMDRKEQECTPVRHVRLKSCTSESKEDEDISFDGENYSSNVKEDGKSAVASQTPTSLDFRLRLSASEDEGSNSSNDYGQRLDALCSSESGDG